MNNNIDEILNSEENNIVNIIPIVTYSNTDTDKSIIYTENRNKWGVYRWNNLINGKSYIGSSRDLSNRLAIYYSLVSLKRKREKGSNYIYIMPY